MTLFLLSTILVALLYSITFGPFVVNQAELIFICVALGFIFLPTFWRSLHNSRKNRINKESGPGPEVKDLPLPPRRIEVLPEAYAFFFEIGVMALTLPFIIAISELVDAHKKGLPYGPSLVRDSGEILFSIYGLCLAALAVGAYLRLRTKQILKNGLVTKPTETSVMEATSWRTKSKSYTICFSFRTSDGTECNDFISTVDEQTFERMNQGDGPFVIYDPRRPRRYALYPNQWFNIADD